MGHSEAAIAKLLIDIGNARRALERFATDVLLEFDFGEGFLGRTFVLEASAPGVARAEITELFTFPPQGGADDVNELQYKCFIEIGEQECAAGSEVGVYLVAPQSGFGTGWHSFSASRTPATDAERAARALEAEVKSLEAYANVPAMLGFPKRSTSDSR